jgi:hypothetical protein
MASLRRNSFTAVDASLSIIWNLGCSPASVSCLYSTVYAHTASVSDLDFIGSAKMAFPSYSYNISTYLFPLLDVVGNLPVISVYTFPSILLLLRTLRLFVVARYPLVRSFLLGFLSFSSSGGGGVVSVVLTLCLAWFVPCVPLLLQWCAYSVCSCCPLSFPAMMRSFHFLLFVPVLF